MGRSNGLGATLAPAEDSHTFRRTSEDWRLPRNPRGLDGVSSKHKMVSVSHREGKADVGVRGVKERRVVIPSSKRTSSRPFCHGNVDSSEKVAPCLLRRPHPLAGRCSQIPWAFPSLNLSSGCHPFPLCAKDLANCSLASELKEGREATGFQQRGRMRESCEGVEGGYDTILSLPAKHTLGPLDPYCKKSM